MDWSLLFTGENLAAFATLTVMEVVLGIDNIIFIAILCARLPEGQRDKARKTGLLMAMAMRIGLLLGISWIIQAKEPLFTLPIGAEGHPVSVKDLILLGGGLFLVYKATKEIHNKIEGEEHHAAGGTRTMTFGSAVGQILLLDLVFSLDSVITAVGMVHPKQGQEWAAVATMCAAVVIAVAVMLLAAGRVAGFIDRHPTVKMLALAFLLIIGVTLVAEGTHAHIPKGYIYAAMAFSVLVEALNMAAKRRHKMLGVATAGLPPGPGAVHHQATAPDRR